MSETNIHPNPRQYEGPAELYGAHYDARMANDGDTFFTRQYGERGVGWDFDTSTHAVENDLELYGSKVDHKLAREALANQAMHGAQVTNEGEPVTNRQVDAMTRSSRPPKGSLVIYPDGKVHQAQKNSDQA